MLLVAGQYFVLAAMRAALGEQHLLAYLDLILHRMSCLLVRVTLV